jgi:hypothetical protein
VGGELVPQLELPPLVELREGESASSWLVFWGVTSR